jgi:hypothetical protein
MVDPVKLMVGVTTDGHLRHALFIDYISGVIKPDGTILAPSHGASPARGRNNIIRAALEQNCTHIMFFDDDMHMPADCINKLLAHDLDIVCGLYLMRGSPHFPLMFDKAYPDGRCLHSFLTKGREGLVEVENTGFGCALIKTEVFKKMPGPYWVTLGEYEKDHWCDDLSFFNRAREYGYRIFVDTDVQCGHMTNAILYPVKDSEGNWFTGMSTGQGMVQIPQHVPDLSMVTYDEEGNPVFPQPEKVNG